MIVLTPIFPIKIAVSLPNPLPAPVMRATFPVMSFLLRKLGMKSFTEDSRTYMRERGTAPIVFSSVRVNPPTPSVIPDFDILISADSDK